MEANPLPSPSAPALLLASGVIGCVSLFACAYLLATMLRLCRGANVFRHAAVALTLIPVSYVLCMILTVTYNSICEALHAFAKEHQADLPSLFVYAAAAARLLVSPVDLSTTMWMTCLLFVAYGIANVWHHLIDITRMLKVSRRRMIVREVAELRKEAEAAAKAGMKPCDQ
ncbi:hypothetical protein ABL78_5292 [Leptomonas seymouri]|uniref:Uncharacterized protein n=1 Tax=Leptomonas seymouri TaxID=5684 RepID=A0A0N1IJY8_LEPSE|nr:hypothetical protein ABL78_5292 [Leptomonas seymouri]|eukprot:KPI85642.1 hypothetical protein ABL78_5292 [Leptomonas seymouri]